MHFTGFLRVKTCGNTAIMSVQIKKSKIQTVKKALKNKHTKKSIQIEYGLKFSCVQTLLVTHILFNGLLFNFIKCVLCG